MANRTNNDRVLSILSDTDNLQKDSSGKPDCSVFIEMANEITTEYCGDAGYSDSRLEMIEMWLAAHFITLSRQQQVSSESAGGVSYSLGPSSRNQGAGFASTRFGTTAISLDSAGGLLRAAQRQEKGHLKNKCGIYGGRGSTRPGSDTEQPGNYPG